MKKLLFLCALSSSSLSFTAYRCQPEEPVHVNLQTSRGLVPVSISVTPEIPMILKMHKKPDGKNSTLSQYEWKNVSDRVGSVYWEGVLKSEHRYHSLLSVKLSRRMSFGEYSKS